MNPCVHAPPAADYDKGLESSWPMSDGVDCRRMGILAFEQSIFQLIGRSAQVVFDCLRSVDDFLNLLFKRC